LRQLDVTMKIISTTAIPIPTGHAMMMKAPITAQTTHAS